MFLMDALPDFYFFKGHVLYSNYIFMRIHFAWQKKKLLAFSFTKPKKLIYLIKVENVHN